MSDHPMVMALHAAISRRNWHAVEQAANQIRDHWPDEATIRADEREKCAAIAADLIESQAQALSEAEAERDDLRIALSGVNKDWNAAMDRALAAESRLAEASTHITDLANELRAEIEVRYAGTLNYPSQKKKYQMDLEPVAAARDFLNAAKEKT